MIPTFNAQRQAEALQDELLEAARRVLLSGGYILGPEVQGFQEEVGEYLGADHAIGVASGTDALWLALRAVGVGPGDLVLTTPFTFFATASSILNCGAKPVLADIDPRSYNIDPDCAANALRGESPSALRLGVDPDLIKAIVPVHLYGNPAPMRELLPLAEEQGVAVVEDAAQAMGTRYQGKHVGVLGDVGCFSFFPTKNLGACGDAGLVTTQRPELAEALSALAKHGSAKKYHHTMVGTNSRLDSLQAALLRAKLPHLDGWLETRREHAAAYTQALEGATGLILPSCTEHDSVHSFHQYTIRVTGGRRDALQAHLHEQGIGSTVYYPVPLHLQPALADLGYRAGDFPAAEQAAEEVLSLPMFPELTAAERDTVCAQVRTFLDG